MTRATALGLALAVAALSAALALGGGAGVGAVPDGADDASGWSAPVPGEVLRSFDRPEQDWAAGHRGADLAAEVGAGVSAPASGTVAFAGVVAGRGVVTIAHPGGLRSSLEPVDATVVVGTAVARGDPIGVVGVDARGPHCAVSCPTCAAACVHWGVRAGEDYLDPLGLLPARGPVVLLPDR